MPIVRLQLDLNGEQDQNYHLGNLTPEQLADLKKIINEFHAKLRRGDI